MASEVLHEIELTEASIDMYDLPRLMAVPKESLMAQIDHAAYKGKKWFILLTKSEMEMFAKDEYRGEKFSEVGVEGDERKPIKTELR